MAYNRDFDTETVGAVSNYSAGDIAGVYTVDQTVYYGASGKSLKCDSNSQNIGHDFMYDSSKNLSSGDGTYTARIRLGVVNDNSSCRTGILLRYDSTANNGYVAMLRPLSGNRSIRLSKLAAGGAETVITTATYTGQFTQDAWYNIEVVLSGSSIRVRVWLDGDSEPSTWDINVSDPSYPNTRLGTGVYFYHGATTAASAYIDSVSESSSVLFEDNFETNNFSKWSSSSLGGGDLSTSSGSALHGSYGMSAFINDTGVLYVQDDSPEALKRYRCRFYFDPNSLPMSDGDSFNIFRAVDSTITTAYVVVLSYTTADGYRIHAVDRTDAANFSKSTSTYVITDSAHYIEIDWKASSASGANDGYLSLYIDGVLKETVTSIDSDGEAIDSVRLGAAQNIYTIGKSVDFYSESNYSIEDAMYQSFNGYAQSFTATGNILDNVRLYLRKTGSPTSNLTVSIYEHSGTFGTNSVPSATVVATSDAVASSTLSTSYGLITFSFSGSNRVLLQNGTKYVLVLTGGYDNDSNFIYIGEDDSSPSHSGNFSYRQSTTWTASSSKDLLFYVNGNAEGTVYFDDFVSNNTGIEIGAVSLTTSTGTLGLLGVGN